jgi:hypothetical protein
MFPIIIIIISSSSSSNNNNIFLLHMMQKNPQVKLYLQLYLHQFITYAEVHVPAWRPNFSKASLTTYNGVCHRRTFKQFTQIEVF